MQSKNEIIGITTTVPVEILIAAGYIPEDLNNYFVNHSNPLLLVEKAEQKGFPSNSCSWIKGIFSSIIEQNIKKIIAPVWGDCSNTFALCEVLQKYGVEIVEFSYPFNRDLSWLKNEFNRLFKIFNVSEKEVFNIFNKLKSIREKLKIIDNLTIQGKVSSFENHLWLVTSSDFNKDIFLYEKELDKFLIKAEKRTPVDYMFRLGYIGVPPVFSDFYSFFEKNNIGIIFNEIQREFSMIDYEGEDFYSQYINYSYPYGMNYRVKKIKKEIKYRKLNGIIHYTQCFCYRQIEDIILRDKTDVPILTIEGDKPGTLDNRTKMRLENFFEIL
ncbi:MAG: 2-hydroxyacyl-CoA dehydratase family protein [Candidatus Muiribacteriota bacterium]